MPGFCIYAGEMVNQPTLTEMLQNHTRSASISFGAETLDLLSRVTDFSLRPDGVMQFMYQWDEPLSYNYRGRIEHVVRTFNLNVRIVTGDHHLYFLVEKDVKYGKSRDVMIELAKIIYNSTRRILNAYIVSDLIKQIEGQDSMKLETEWFRAVSSLDKAIGIFGELDTRNDDGTRGLSETHRRYKNREKTASTFLSYSKNGVRVYISANKSSVTLKAPSEVNVSLNDVEQYVRALILPKIVVESLPIDSTN